MAIVRKHVVVHGHVQGVFFRAETRRRAQRAGVAGWVRNARDGTVEAVFEGESDAVARLIDFAHLGPPGAAVERVDVVDEPPDGLTGFVVQL